MSVRFSRWLSALRPFFETFLRGLLQPRFITAAVVAWILYGTILAIVVAVEPDRRTVTPNYRQAAEKWWKGEEDIYKDKKKGFLYLPQSAICYTPFVLVPKRVGEPLWRLVGLAALAFALWRAAALLQKTQASPNAFAVLTLLVLPSSFASAGNGQANILLSALFLHAAVDYARSNQIRASFWLILACALKPLALVMILLAGALVRGARLPLIGGMILVLLAPFLHPDPAYVWRQFQLGFEVLRSASQPDIHAFCDIAGMFRTFGLPLPDWFWTGVRLLAALTALGFSWLALRRLPVPWGILFLYTMSVLYLVLFNPRTEANTYILLTPAVSLIFWRTWCARPGGWAPLLLALYAIGLGVDSYAFLHNWTNLWFKALTTCFFAVYLVRNHLLKPLEEPGESRS